MFKPEVEQKRQKTDEDAEDRFFNKMTGWMNTKLEAQADRYLDAVKAEVSSQLTLVNASIQRLISEQSNTTTRLGSIEKDQQQVRQEWEDFKTNTYPSLAAAAAAQPVQPPSEGRAPFLSPGHGAGSSRDFINLGYSSTVGASSNFGGDKEADPRLFIFGTFSGGMPTNQVIKQVKDEALKCQPPIEFISLSGRQPDCEYLFGVCKPTDCLDSIQDGWVFSKYLRRTPLIPFGARAEDVDQYGKPVRVWSAQAKPKANPALPDDPEEKARKSVNMCRRFPI